MVKNTNKTSVTNRHTGKAYKKALKRINFTRFLNPFSVPLYCSSPNKGSVLAYAYLDK